MDTGRISTSSNQPRILVVQQEISGECQLYDAVLRKTIIVLALIAPTKTIRYTYFDKRHASGLQ